ncbi:hypothetical protein GRI42_02340 [Erythrobacter gaetbuli]|uniref:Uncharacterized protein n=1 Tax=Qipengyuania gaetbuli TaxID=266952 RepID=A0A844XW90_9SPHN|nr:hypothetical protein [Qipengyuania gaetbuli]MXO50141.1 hypothetical protein [Qipengyuania gaetbuli]
MNNKTKLFVDISLKDTFIHNKKIHTGFYDGIYRRLIKNSINEIKNKTSYGMNIYSHFEIMDFPESTHLRIVLSVPDNWDATRFEEISLNVIKKNPSVDIILETFQNSSAETQKRFFSYQWKGFSKSRFSF